MVEVSAGGMEFRAGSVIARSFSTFFRNILPFGLLALVVTSPTYVYTILTLPSDLAGFETEFSFGSGVTTVVELLLTYLVTAALVYGTIQDLRNNRVSVGDCFSQGLARMFPALGVAILSGILTMLAFVALIIPGFMVMAMLWVTIPVVVIERRGIGSLGRSMELTKGYRWRIFLILLVLFVILIAMSLLIGVVTAGMMFGGSGEMNTMFTGVLAMQWILSAFISAFMAVLSAVSYHDLRVAREGVDTDRIASVFD